MTTKRSTPPDCSIAVPYSDVTGEMILRNSLGSGSYGGVDFELDATVGSGNYVITFGGKAYLVNLADVVKALINAEAGSEQP